MKKIGQFSETYILQTTKPIFFKFGIYSHVYGGHKICKFDRNRSSGFRDMGVEYGDLVVPVNNTLVRHTSSLATDTRLCVLITALENICDVEWI